MCADLHFCAHMHFAHLFIFCLAKMAALAAARTLQKWWRQVSQELYRCGECNRLIPPAHFELLDREQAAAGCGFGEQLRCPAHTCPCVLSDAADRDGVTYRGEPVPPQAQCPICWELVCTGQYCALRVTCNCAYSDNGFSVVFKR